MAALDHLDDETLLSGVAKLPVPDGMDQTQ
jgi:hypothetical protein